MKDSMVETAVGAIVIVIAAAFFLFAYTVSGKGSTSGGYHVTAAFDNVEGINVGSDVRMAGIKIGTVTGQSLDPETFQAVLKLEIARDVPLADDTTAKITAEGLLGSKFVALDPGGSETHLSEGGVITYTQGSVDIWKLIATAMFNTSKPKDGAAPAAPQPGASSETQPQ